MTKYKVWISCGDSSWHRTYFNELGSVQLNQEQVSKYFTFDESGEIQFDSDLLSEETDRDWDDEERSLPTWDTITDGCICWGPDAADQNIGVCLADDDEKQIWVQPIEQLPYYTKDDIEEGLPEQDDSKNGYARIFYEMNEPDGVWMVYNSYERGGYEGEFEIPDGEEFDPTKLVVNLTEVADCWTIVSGIEYNGEDIYCDGDTMGKGIDWYIYHRGELHSFK
jgi:hypothetical protein